MTLKDAVTIHDQTNILPRRHLVVFAALASALLIIYIDQSSIRIALPTIGRDLDCASTVVWAGTSSLIANTAFQVLYGKFSDIFGRKAIIIASLGMLALGDLLCGFARSGPQLYAFRGISGIANSRIMALAMMIVSDVVTLEERGKFQGILGSCVGLGNTVGPFLAAAFTKTTSWRDTF
ncbi:MFS general substrate transporter [Glonium stellatum]|uniref:MFS general substrate transporter n=1 Tax=Glonium stellatum TaxID=574774 RepID=A0A8E2JS41_9PEZI|nr:MFS general substrate transporter [Glonium stellatum]